MKMRSFKVRVSCEITVEAPADSPIFELFKLIEQYSDQSDSWSDGRYPYSVELMHDGATRIVDRAVYEALDRYWTDRMEANRGRHLMGPGELDERNKRVERYCKEIRIHARGDGDRGSGVVVPSTDEWEAK